MLTGMLSVAMLTGCPKQENLPTALDLVTAPAPSDFTITSLGLDTTTGEYKYDLTWSISDPTNVKGYRLYLVGGGFVPQLLADLDASTSRSITLPSNAVALQFGLSTVSTGSVESAMVVAVVPPVQP